MHDKATTANNWRTPDPNPRNKYNLAPETARVGYKYGKYIWGVTQGSRVAATGGGAVGAERRAG